RLPMMLKLSNSPLHPGWFCMLKRIFHEEKPNIINTHSPVPGLVDVSAAAGKDVPLVVTYHSGSMRKGKLLADNLIGMYEALFLKMLFKRASAIIAISQEFARKKFPQFSAKTYFIPTGVDLVRFKPTPLSLD